MRGFQGLVLAAAVAATCALPRATPFDTTPLDDYVNAPDSHYTYSLIPNATFHGVGYKGYVLNMTSQQWLTDADSSRSIWWHYMAVVVPDDLHYKTTGLMYITGGSNNDHPPTGTGEDELLCISLALLDRTVCTVLFQIPNEPIVFPTDPTHANRDEDAIIAFTWNHFINNPNEPEWLLRLPMTKAAVRAMDTITDFVEKTLGNSISSFIVAGASKRGWTTWTTGAVDKRVIAIVPMVMDLLSLVKNVHHMWRAYGGWTFAFTDYYAMNFTQNIDRPEMQQMADIIDPFSYIDRLTMPKLVVDATGDEFFMLDDNWMWWDDMLGEIHLLMCQNAEHSLATGLVEVLEGVASFALGVLENSARPSMTWNITRSNTSGTIDLQTSEAPISVEVWHADTLNHSRRDWRLIIGGDPCPYIPVKGDCIQPVLWSKVEPQKITDTSFTVSFDAPEAGWRAFFMQAKFHGVGSVDYTFTTQVNIIPDYYPFPDCSGLGCRGTLI